MKSFSPLFLTLLSAGLMTASSFAQGFPCGQRDTLGPQFHGGALPPVAENSPQFSQQDIVRRWNGIALHATALDHTPVTPGKPGRVFGEQLGPTRSSRALAIIHIAIFEAINAIRGGYESHLGIPPASPHASVEAAVAQSARDSLVALFPSQASFFDHALSDDLTRIPAGPAKTDGINLGKNSAAAIMEWRADDGSAHPEVTYDDFSPSDAPGKWRQDPISQAPIALGAYWGEVQTFVIKSADQFRAPAPPTLQSKAYAAAFTEVKRLGGDGVTTSTARTSTQTFIGTFWGYDGTPGLGAPPRLYNQITVAIADRHRTGPVELARLLALVNVAMADAGIATWETKYFYQYWRPVTGIREADVGTGPSGLGDDNPRTAGDPNFTPLGAPASNLSGPNFTPPFPAYPSGHAAFGGALFQTLRRFYGTDAIPFTFVSDEFNGITKDQMGYVRPRVPRHFNSLSQAEEENGQSRIYLGIHWSFDKTAGIAQGRQVADYVFGHCFQPVRTEGHH